MFSRLSSKLRRHKEHIVRETTLDSYRELDASKLGKMQMEIYSYLKRSIYPQTDREIARALGYSDPNKVRPRRFELMKAGLIVEDGTSTCSVTNKKAIVWRVKVKGVERNDC